MKIFRVLVLIYLNYLCFVAVLTRQRHVYIGGGSYVALKLCHSCI